MKIEIVIEDSPMNDEIIVQARIDEQKPSVFLVGNWREAFRLLGTFLNSTEVRICPQEAARFFQEEAARVRPAPKGNQLGEMCGRVVGERPSWMGAKK